MFSKADVLVSNFHSHRLKKNPFIAEMLNGACCSLTLPPGWDLTPTSGSQTEASGNRGGGGERRAALPRSFS